MADGLAFSVKAGNSTFPPTLQRILENLYSDLFPQDGRPSKSDLTPWAQRGVLLLNAALTLRPEAPARSSTPRQMWDPFTAAVIRALNLHSEPVVFMFWGDDAARFAPLVSYPHKVIKSAHPSLRNVGRTTVLPPFDSTRPFSEANNFLGSRRVDWRL